MADLEALLRSAQAAMTAASESAALKLRRPTRWRPPEQVLSAVAKTAIGVAGRLRRQWLRWLTEHGEAYEYDASVGPTVEHVLHFQTHGFKTRLNQLQLAPAGRARRFMGRLGGAVPAAWRSSSSRSSSTRDGLG